MTIRVFSQCLGWRWPVAVDHGNRGPDRTSGAGLRRRPPDGSAAAGGRVRHLRLDLGSRIPVACGSSFGVFRLKNGAILRHAFNRAVYEVQLGLLSLPAGLGLGVGELAGMIFGRYARCAFGFE